MKKAIIGGAAGIALVTGLIVGGLKATNTKADTTYTDPAVTQQLQHDKEQLDNHEARITNTEADVSSLQQNTGTAPSNNRTSVPSVTTTSPTQSINNQTTPASQSSSKPIAITSVQQIPNGEDETDCIWTYSDGTTFTIWFQKWTINQGSKITQTNGKCDNSLIGKTKE